MRHMQFPNLDNVTRKALNALTVEEAGGYYAYGHELLSYGVDAVVHAYLMRMARDISEGRISQEDFFKKYDLDFIKIKNAFIVPIKKIESDGIFIPYHPDEEPDSVRSEWTVWLFNQDYGNRVDHDCWVDKEYAWELMGRKWQPSDLENPQIVEKGVKFGKDMWQTCINGFHKYKNGDPKFNEPAQPQKITDLGEKLIEYYSALVSEPTTSK